MKKISLIFIILVAALALIRFYFAATLGLGDDEAYYWEWSRHLALSYYDQPPLIAYLIWLFTAWGGNTELMVRMGNVLLSLAATLCTYLWARETFEQEKAGLWAVLLLSLVPIFALGAIFAFPDGPLGAFWIITLFLVHRALRTQRHFFWYLAGLGWGLALLSKYNGILLGLIVLVYLLAVKEDRFWLKRKEPYLAAVIAFLVFLPVLVWNYQHGFASFLFHLTHKGSKASPFQSFLLFLLPPFGYLSPLVYLGGLWALGWVLREGWRRSSPRFLFLSLSSLVPLIFFALVSFKGKFKPHYPALGFYPALVAFAGIYAAGGGSKFRRGFFLAAFGLCLLFNTAMLLSTQWPLTGKAILFAQDLASTLPFPGLGQKIQHLSRQGDAIYDFYGWRQAAPQAQEIYDQLTKEGPAFIFGERYQIVSPLAFYMGPPAKVYCLTARRDQYKYFAPPVKTDDSKRATPFSPNRNPTNLSARTWSEKIKDYITHKKWEPMEDYLVEISRLKGQNALFVCDSRYFLEPTEEFIFKNTVLEKKLVIKSDGLALRTIYFYKCYDFQGLRDLLG